MSGFFKKKTQQTRLTGKRPLRLGFRLIGMICIIAMLLGACSGCTSNDPAGQEAAIRVAQEEIEVLKAKNDAAQAELHVLKEWKQAAQEQIDALNAANTASQQEMAALKATSQLAQQEIDALKAGNAASQQEIDALKAASQEAKKEIDALKAGNKVSQQELDALKATSQAAQQEMEALKAEILALQQKVDALQTDNTTAKAEIDALKAENEALQQEIDVLKTEMDALQREIDQVKERFPKIRLYIDQGHNPATYHNAGAVGNGLYEGDVTFTIGCALAQLLESDGRFEVCLSRPEQNTVLGTDNSSSLAARVQGAENFGADYFISLHINSFTSDTAHGIEVYVKEEGSESYDFGSSLLQGLIDATALNNRNMKTNPDLYVLKNVTMPAALLEMGFISNPDDAALLESNPELFAQGIYNGILSYFDLTDVNAPTN